MTKLFLLVTGILFFLYGLYALFNVHVVGGNWGITNLPEVAAYELRSNYGGINLGIGLFSIVSVLRESLQKHAVYLTFVFTGSYAIGRLLALPFDGDPSARIIVFGVYEALVALLALWLIIRTKG